MAVEVIRYGWFCVCDHIACVHHILLEECDVCLVQRVMEIINEVKST